MANFFLQQPRLSYAQPVLPIFRTMLVGGVLVMLALLTGFVAPGPSTMARPLLPARGPLIEAAQHPEWKQFLVQAAYRRAGELDELRRIPDTPIVMPAPPVIEVVPPAITEAVKEPAAQVASLPPTDAEEANEEITASIEEPPAGAMSVDIGEASATELPIQDLDTPTPVQRPATLKRDESRRPTPPRRQVKRAKPPAPAPAEPDFLTRLFGGSSTDRPVSAAPPR